MVISDFNLNFHIQAALSTQAFIKPYTPYSSDVTLQLLQTLKGVGVFSGWRGYHPLICQHPPGYLSGVFTWIRSRIFISGNSHPQKIIPWV